MYGDYQSPANEGAYARYEERRFSAVDKDQVPYSHREHTPGHKVEGDVKIVSTCVKPGGEMLYPSNKNPEEVIPHKIPAKLPPVEPYGPSYCNELLHSQWPWFGKK